MSVHCLSRVSAADKPKPFSSQRLASDWARLVVHARGAARRGAQIRSTLDNMRACSGVAKAQVRQCCATASLTGAIGLGLTAWAE